jgi:uncharacterized protein YdeI (YjbR/CyaY-like superfamily)
VLDRVAAAVDAWPMTTPDAERVQPETIAHWRAWLDEHHESSKGVWLVTWRKHTGRPTVGYDAAVTEALAVGWVDSKGLKLDDDRTMLWFTRRRTTSGWSRPNKERVERLYAEGRMGPAGHAAIDTAKENGTWSLLDDVENLVVPDDLASAFDQHPGAREAWEEFPRSAKRSILEWIVTAKRPETRRARIAETAEKAGRGERAHQ